MVRLWKMIDPEEYMPNGAEPKHMTWAFYFLKQYATEEVLSVNLGDYDEQTIRKWVWLFVDAISYQESRVVSTLIVRLVKGVCQLPTHKLSTPC